MKSLSLFLSLSLSNQNVFLSFSLSLSLSSLFFFTLQRIIRFLTYVTRISLLRTLYGDETHKSLILTSERILWLSLYSLRTKFDQNRWINSLHNDERLPPGSNRTQANGSVLCFYKDCTFYDGSNVSFLHSATVTIPCACQHSLFTFPASTYPIFSVSVFWSSFLTIVVTAYRCKRDTSYKVVHVTLINVD